MSIPKVIHYCWFGGNPLDSTAKMCLKSWKMYCPDFEIIRWDEDRFDIFSEVFTKEAHKSKKWAFVSDYVRLYALYTIGGIYLDTDFEIIKTLDDTILMNNAVIGYENNRWFSTAFIASKAKNEWIKLLLDYYQNRSFIKADGSMDLKPNPIIVTELSQKKCDFNLGDSFIKTGGVKVMPSVAFSPYKRKNTTEHSAYNISKAKTYGIHHLSASWVDQSNPFRRLQRILRPILPMRVYSFFVSVYNKITFR